LAIAAATGPSIERTATVTAITDAVLLSIERGPFITAVTGHPESLQRADAIIDELLPTTRAYDLL
jgi:CRP-like cAMP-binding protein